MVSCYDKSSQSPFLVFRSLKVVTNGDKDEADVCRVSVFQTSREGTGGRGEREREAGREGGARAKPGNQLVIYSPCAIITLWLPVIFEGSV